jgi:hypothetical protein
VHTQAEAASLLSVFWHNIRSKNGMAIVAFTSVLAAIVGILALADSGWAAPFEGSYSANEVYG